MSTRPVIFISAVSKELRNARTLVARTLDSLGYEAIDQAIAPTETGMLPSVLRDWIDQSDAVIQLVGHHYGFAPKEPDAEFGPCSYTQLEALYARQKGKKVWYLILTPEHPTDPCDAEAPALRELQDAYRTKVKSTAHLYHSSSSLDKTENIVLKLRDELAVLRLEEQARLERQEQVTAATHQNTAEILAGINALQQQAHRQPQLPLTPASWPQPAPFHNRAFPDQHNFVGRTALLSAMKQSLDAELNVALTQPVAMHGAGGIGKTRAAVEFARAHGGDYMLRLFLDAQSPESLRASLAEVARKLELTPDPQAKEKDLVLLALRLLRAVPTALVVADNADTPAALEAVRLLCHQPGGVRWLITTRLTDLGEEFAAQPVELLSEAEAVKLLQQRGRKNRHHPGSDTEALAVAIELGRLPLALQQAAAYVAHMRLTWTAYSKLLADNPFEALSREAKEMKDLPDSILRTYRISLQQLSPLALRLLEVAAHLAPAPMPEGVFLHKDDDNARRAALVELADLSLLVWESGQLELHRAITIAVRHGIRQDERRARLEEACSLVAASPPHDVENPVHWPVWASLRPHMEHLLFLVGPAGVKENSYMLLQALLSIYLSQRGELFAAERFSSLAAVLYERALGLEHPETLMVKNNWAGALFALGKNAEAEALHRQLLALRIKVLGIEHADTLMSRNNLAAVVGMLGKHAEAEQEHRSVLAVRQRTLGDDHLQTLQSRNNIAVALDAQGKHAASAQEHRAVLAVKERVLGVGHPGTLESRNNLALSLRSLGRYEDAIKEHRAVLLLQLDILGAKHPDTLHSRMNLAVALASQGQHAEVEEQFREVLSMMQSVLGIEHPDLDLICYNLALCLYKQNKMREAFVFAKRAEDGFYRNLGDDSSDYKQTRRLNQCLEEVLKTPPKQPG